MKTAPLWGIFLVLFILEILGVTGFLNTSLVPPPHVLLRTFQEDSQILTQSFFETFWSVGIGYLLAIALGCSGAILLSAFSFLRDAVLPIAIFFQTVPIIAIAPLLVIYFGYGQITVIVSSFIVALFPILANALQGLQSVSSEELELFKVLQARPWQVLFYLRIPRSYPLVYAGLKISAGLAVIGAVAGEFVAGGGLGALIDSARTQQRIDLVFCSLILLAFQGLIFIFLLRFFHQTIQKVRPLGMDIQETSK